MLEVGDTVEAFRGCVSKKGVIKEVIDPKNFTVQLQDGKLKKYNINQICYTPSPEKIQEECRKFRSMWGTPGYNPGDRAKTCGLYNRLLTMIDNGRRVGRRHWKGDSTLRNGRVDEGYWMVVKHGPKREVIYAGVWRA